MHTRDVSVPRTAKSAIVVVGFNLAGPRSGDGPIGVPPDIFMFVGSARRCGIAHELGFYEGWGRWERGGSMSSCFVVSNHFVDERNPLLFYCVVSKSKRN